MVRGHGFYGQIRVSDIKIIPIVPDSGDRSCGSAGSQIIGELGGDCVKGGIFGDRYLHVWLQFQTGKPCGGKSSNGHVIVHRSKVRVKVSGGYGKEVFKAEIQHGSGIDIMGRVAV